jgi:hypothetical protein
VLAHFGRLPNDGRYYSTLVLAELLVVAQALLGVILLVSGATATLRDPIHVLYGGLSVILLPTVYGMATRRGWSTALACGLVTLFMFGLGVRAFTTTYVGFAGLFANPG